VCFYFSCFIKRRVTHTPLWSSPVDRICKITWTTEDIELQAGGNCSLSPHRFTLKSLQKGHACKEHVNNNPAWHTEREYSALLLFFSLQRSGDILCPLQHNLWGEPIFEATSRLQVFWVNNFNWINSVYIYIPLLMNRESQCFITGIIYVATLAHNKWGFIDWDKCSKLIFALENISVLIYLSSVSP
jgi:hypothetical protein